MAKKHSLLYVSDTGTNDVYVYLYQPNSLKSVKLEGTLTDFNYPTGECVDKAGDVFVTSKVANQIVEYAHGRTKPIATLSDAGQYPVACSIDPVTGDLAVSNAYGVSYGSTGSVSIYAGAKGTPVVYADPNELTGFFCGYDQQGNLFVDGLTEGYTSDVFHLIELRHGRHRFENITLNQTLKVPGNVQWDGKYLTLGDQSANVIYRFAINGTKATEAGATQLGEYGQGWEVVQYWIQKEIVIGPGTISGQPTVGYWNFPTGGDAIKSFTGGSHPFGSVVSAGK